MEIGLKLDMLIAEHVMGLPKRDWNVDDCMCGECGLQARWCGERAWCSNCHEWRYAPYAEYSLYIAYAWEVVEKMKEKSNYKGNRYCNRDPWLSFCNHLSNDDDGFNINFWEINPHTICIAALKAVGVEI